MTPRIYLAGPGVFYPDPHTHARELKRICQCSGLQGVFPMDCALDLSGLSKHQAAQAIYDANIEMINSCQGVMADMQAFRGPGMDGGTAFEMGYAKARNLPIVGYGLTDTYLARTRQYYGSRITGNDPVYDPNAMVVEDFDLVDNLMMACGATALVATPEEAAKCLSRLCAAG